jgi:hypothetical protein
MVVGFCGLLLFLFVPESFWDRTPVPKSRKQSKNGSRFSLFSHRRESHAQHKDVAVAQADGHTDFPDLGRTTTTRSVNESLPRPALAHRQTPTRALHVGFAPDDHAQETEGYEIDDNRIEGHSSPLSNGAINLLDVESPGKIQYSSEILIILISES